MHISPNSKGDVNGGKDQLKGITRPIRNLLKLRKDASRIPSVSGILRASSFKHPCECNKKEPSPECITTNNNAIGTTNNHPPLKLAGPKIVRAATIRSTAIIKSDNNKNSNSANGSETRTLCSEMLHSIRLKFLTPAQPLSSASILLNTSTQTTIERIRQALKSLPSVIQQQDKGTNFTPGWNWTTQLHKLMDECSRKRYATDMTDQILMQFCTHVYKASSILEQIRLDFQYGISNEVINGANCDELMKELNIIGPGARGRTTLNLATIPNISEIFRYELSKQQVYYDKWMGNPLPDPQTCKRRNEQVVWLCKTGVTLKYPAETIHLAVYLIDTYLSKGNKVSSCGWALLAIAALQIAGKLEEPQPANTGRLIRLSGQYYKHRQVCWMERHLLGTLQFNVCPPLAPLFAQMVLIGGSLEFPTVNIRKLVMDLSMGILYNSLRNHKLHKVRPSEKAQAALEIAVDFIFFQYGLYSRRDLKHYECPSIQPGKELGEFAVKLATEMFQHRFSNRTAPAPYYTAGTGSSSSLPKSNLKM